MKRILKRIVGVLLITGFVFGIYMLHLVNKDASLIVKLITAGVMTIVTFIGVAAILGLVKVLTWCFD